MDSIYDVRHPTASDIPEAYARV